MTKKSQAALEYLVEYGWAILAILFIAAVLWYLGVFDPARYSQSPEPVNCSAVFKNASSYPAPEYFKPLSCVNYGGGAFSGGIYCSNVSADAVRVSCESASTPIPTPTVFDCVFIDGSGNYHSSPNYCR